MNLSRIAEKIFSVKKNEDSLKVVNFLGFKKTFKKKDKTGAILKEIEESKKKFHYILHISGKLDIETKRKIIAERFYNTLGYYPNLDNPVSLNEKTQWLKLYHKNPLAAICSDKFKVKEHISKEIGEGYTAKLLASYDDPSEIDFGILPEQFVLKVNWCTNFNIIVKNKNKLDKNKTKALLNKWSQPWQNLYYSGFNYSYKDMPCKIFAEEYLGTQGTIKDYKFFCFNGNPEFFFIHFGLNSADNSWNFYDMDRNFINCSKKKQIPEQKPESFDEMVRIAKKLSAPFVCIRIDFMEINGKLYLSELTSYSGGGFSTLFNREWDFKFGEKLILPKEKML